MKARISKLMSRDKNDRKIVLALKTTLFTCTDGDKSVENKMPRSRADSTTGTVKYYHLYRY